MYLLEMWHSIIAMKWLISRIQAAWTNPFSPTSLKSLRTERNNISKYKYQKGQRLNSDSYLSLLVLIFCRHALKLLRLLLPKQTRDSMHSCAVLARRPHHSISNGARLLSWLLPIVSYNIWHCGLAPNSGGGLSLHAVTRLWEDPPQDEDGLRWQVCIRAARDVRHASTSVHNSAGCKKAPFSFSTARGLCSVVFQCMVGNGCTRAWRRWYTAAWKDYASVVTFWYENSCDSCLFCTRFGRTTVALKIHIGSIL